MKTISLQGKRFEFPFGGTIPLIYVQAQMITEPEVKANNR